MVRRSTGSMILAYWSKNDIETPFKCLVRYNRNITNDMGELMANGGATLTTRSKLQFKQNDVIRIGNETYTINTIDDEVDKTNKNAYRGNPSFNRVITLS